MMRRDESAAIPLALLVVLVIVVIGVAALVVLVPGVLNRPVVDFSYVQASTGGTTYQFTAIANGFDTSCGPVLYSWDFGDASPVTPKDANTVVSHQFPFPGVNYTVTMDAWPCTGPNVYDTPIVIDHKVYVPGTPLPSLVLTVSVSVSGNVVTLLPALTGCVNAPCAIRVDWGDNSGGYGTPGKPMTHTYYANGTFTIQAGATDTQLNGSNWVTTSVTIGSGPAAWGILFVLIQVLVLAGAALLVLFRAPLPMWARGAVAAFLAAIAILVVAGAIP